jgi:hypothetical protein
MTLRQSNKEYDVSFETRLRTCIRVARGITLMQHTSLRATLWILLLPTTGCSSTQPTEDSFQLQQTEKLLGIPVRSFPDPRGSTGFDVVPADAPRLGFKVTEEMPSGDPPPKWFRSRGHVTSIGPDGAEWDAYCGSAKDECLQPGHGYVSTLENRRHHYPNKFDSAFNPKDIFIGTKLDGKLVPRLF